MIHPDCLWIPSPNYGYPRGALKQLEGGGEFWHSMVGSLVAAKHRFLNPAEEASAHFLFPRNGIPTQMVDSDDASWHSGNYLANLYFHGFEFEGGAPGNLSEPLTENQIEWGIKITRWLRDVHGSPQIYVRRETLWEHNEVQATSCPSGRIPWERLIQELEDDMPAQAEWDAMKVWQREHSVLFRDTATTAAILIQGATHRLVDDPEVVATLGYANAAYLSVPHSYIMDRAPHNGGSLTVAEAQAIVNPSGGGDGLSADQARGIAKDEIDLSQVKAAR